MKPLDEELNNKKSKKLVIDVDKAYHKLYDINWTDREKQLISKGFEEHYVYLQRFLKEDEWQIPQAEIFGELLKAYIDKEVEKKIRLNMNNVKCVGRIYKGQNGQVYDPSGISPTLRAGTTNNPKHGGIGSSNSPKIIVNVSTKTMEILPQLTLENYPASTYSLEDFLAKLSALQEKGEDLTKQEELSFLKSQGFSETRDPDILYSKMLKVYFLMTGEKLSRQYLGFSPTWGMSLNGRYLTAKILESHKTERESSLADILEENVDQKYFLSEKLQ